MERRNPQIYNWHYSGNRHKVLQINSLPDHIHILVGLSSAQPVSASVKNVKAESTKRSPGTQILLS
ncbi:transposase [Foetidibacter luteolus]|uniref:transposase n=1 Tax=Foetidibacter luteolus TaxID=2608880 RepID=UPI00129BEB97